MQRFFARLVFAFSIAGGAVCLLLHVGTFFTVIPPIWLLVPVALIFGAVLCEQIVGLPQRFDAPALNWKSLVSLILLVYAVLTFVYFYRTTGGASSVGVVGGQYVAMYKSRMIKVISEQDYRIYPSLWTRVMSAWIGMMASFMLTSSALRSHLRSGYRGEAPAEAAANSVRSRTYTGLVESYRLVRLPRDWRTVYLHELAIYELVVPLLVRFTGSTMPLWFFVCQGGGHLLSALTLNKFYWWYGKKAPAGTGRLLIALAGAGWITVGYLLRR